MPSLVFLAATSLSLPTSGQLSISFTDLNPAGPSSSAALAASAAHQSGIIWGGPISGYHPAMWSGTAESLVDLTPAGMEGIYNFWVQAASGPYQVGYFAPSGVGANHAAMWSGTAASFVDLHPSGATDSFARATDGDRQGGRAHLPPYYEGDALIWFGTPNSYVSLGKGSVYGMKGGQQVGVALVGQNPDQHAALWFGTASTRVDLHPFANGGSVAYATSGTQQAGAVWGGGLSGTHGALWSGSAASLVDLHPAAASQSYVYGASGFQQVGFVTITEVNHAALWSGTADSFVDLHAVLGTNYASSVANGVWSDCNTTYVAGQAHTHGFTHAILWTIVGVPFQSPPAISLANMGGTNLTVAVVTPCPFTCRWFFNGSPIAGATGTNLPIPNLNLGHAGAYSVTVSTAAGSASATTILRLPNSPVVLVDGVDVGGGTVDRFAPAQVTMSTSFGPGAEIYYTFDGTDPNFTARLYTAPVTLARTATIRAIAYNQTFTASAEAAPITVQMFHSRTAGGGTVSLTPAIDPTGAGYVTNTVITATATAADGWTFLQWLGEASGTNPVVTATMTPDKAVQAVFGTALTTNVLGSGSILPSPQAPLYPFGTMLRLTALPQPGNYFFGWHGAVEGTNNPATMVVTNANPTITATFAALPANRYTLTVIADGSGSVTATPFANRYPSGQIVSLTAQPDAGQTFLAWSGEASGTANPLSVTMNPSGVITATFTKRPWLSAPADLAGFTRDGFRLLLTGEFGTAYQILSATNLTDWLPLAVVPNPFGMTQYTDTAPTNTPARFYRALQQ